MISASEDLYSSEQLKRRNKMANGKAKQASARQELVRVDPAPLVSIEQMPEFLQQTTQPLGAEEMRPKDVLVARFCLAQKMSAATEEQNASAYIEGLKPGMFYNNVSKKNYGNSVLFIPIKLVLKRAMFQEMEKGGGILCRSEDARTGEGEPGGDCKTCEFAKWSEGNPSPCNEVLTYHILAFSEKGESLGPDNWCVWGAKKSAIKAAKALNGYYKMRGPFDLFKGVYKMTSFWDTTQKKPCWVPKVENAGWVTDRQFAFAKPWFFSIQNLERAGVIRTLDVDPEPDSESETVAV
jgi:hypothetical protein